MEYWSISDAAMGMTNKEDCGCGCGGMKKSNMVRFRYAVYSGLVFLLISSPMMYKFTSSHISHGLASAGGCPTTAGLILHTIVFILLVFLLMMIRS
jgi:hypothetical protein